VALTEAPVALTEAERNAGLVDRFAPTMPPPEYDHPFRGQLHVLSGTQEELRLFKEHKRWPSEEEAALIFKVPADARPAILPATPP
jgi:hypothetical protein